MEYIQQRDQTTGFKQAWYLPDAGRGLEQRRQMDEGQDRQDAERHPIDSFAETGAEFRH